METLSKAPHLGQSADDIVQQIPGLAMPLTSMNTEKAPYLGQGADDIVQQVLGVVADDVAEGEVQAAAAALLRQRLPHRPVLRYAPQVACRQRNRIGSRPGKLGLRKSPESSQQGSVRRGCPSVCVATVGSMTPECNVINTCKLSERRQAYRGFRRPCSAL